MEVYADITPGRPSWDLDWERILAACPWLAPLQGCPQDPRFHGEGDVLTHTRLVCEALAALGAWRELSADDRELVFLAALMHDLGKPPTTRVEGSTVTSSGHSRRGAVMARRLLMESDEVMVLARREQVVGMVARHGLPIWALEREDGQFRVLSASQAVRCDLLALLAEADVRGRRCPDLDDLLDRVELFRELCRENRCLERSGSFPLDHARFLYFRSRGGRAPEVEAFDDTWGPVVLMVGLPGAGKDHWIQHNLPGMPVVSLDAIRHELGIPHHRKKQGRVVQEARERARVMLRARRPFVWNATNLARDLRARVIDLFAGYGARVRIVYVEPDLQTLLRQNRLRQAVVPEEVILKMLQRLRVPDLTEAHEVEWITER